MASLSESIDFDLPACEMTAVSPEASLDKGGLFGAFVVPLWYGAALVAALLLANQPYRGVRHDAMLYLGQTLVRIDPSWWRSDFYFAYGSQDRYTVFSRLFVAPVEFFGIQIAEVLALTIGRVATFWALYLIVDRWPTLQRWLALAAVAGFVHYYGGKSFSALEPFVTARTFAEPLALFAIAAALRGRKGWCAMALFLALLMHPLMTVPAALAIWVYWVVAEDQRWAWAAATLVPVLAMAYAGIAPFDDLLRRYDNAWFYVVGSMNSPAFVSEWVYQAYVAIAGNAALIWLAAWGRRDPLSRFSRVAVILGPLCCGASVYLADWEHNVLLTQLQFWRTIWIGELLLALWVPVLVLDHWRRGSVGRLAAAAVCAGLPPLQDDYGAYSWAMLLWMIIWIVLSLREVVIDRRLVRLAFAATVLMGVIALGQHCWEALYQMRADVRGFGLTKPMSIPFRVPMLTLTVLGFLLTAWQRPRWRVGCAAIAVVVLAMSVWQTDQRNAFTRFVETATPDERPFQSEIPSTARVYWVGKGIAPVWFLLHRAGFGEIAQFAGVLFTRQNAMVAQQLDPFLEETTQRIEHCNSLQSWTSNDYTFVDCIVPLREFRGYCTREGLRPDFVISDVPYPLPRRAQWRFRPRDGSAPVDYFLYSCAAIRALPPPLAK